MAKKKAKAAKSETDKQRNVALWFRLIEAGQWLLTTLIVSAAVVLSVYFGVYLPIKVGAGETTTIKYGLEWITLLKLDVILPIGVGVGGCVYGWRQRSLRMKERRLKDAQIKDYQMRIDPTRTSSGLDVSGEREIPHQ